ncbi:hypothetical protein NP493_10g04024 [Ridgeia piscesae]|uniref:Synaptic plasticity regulator PANTS n=1 Tax=Ridgeia piscesae TaxID=27915 RepID=A0AAD9ULC8_RIDPI|nr:hypothetical protein NP493_10g04024 [Ridgeia piscesae]
MTAADVFPDVKNVSASDKLKEDVWMIRPCEVYHDEYKECKSWKGRFHQYYIHGKTLDCDTWKRDLKNCLEYRYTASQQAAEQLLQSEQTRREARLSKARANDVWEYRTSPPETWSAPLPEYLERTKIPKVEVNQLCVIS